MIVKLIRLLLWIVSGEKIEKSVKSTEGLFNSVSMMGFNLHGGIYYSKIVSEGVGYTTFLVTCFCW